MNPVAWLSGLIERLRRQPYPVRVRILWLTSGTVAVLLLFIWIASVQQEIHQLDPEQSIKMPDQAAESATAAYMAVERVAAGAEGWEVWFRVHNPTDDILNFSAIDEITLQVSGLTLSPTQLWDRQNQPFVQKILSRSENFGLLIFPSLEAVSAELIFRDLYFETTPEMVFQETIRLDIPNLTQSQELRQ